MIVSFTRAAWSFRRVTEMRNSAILALMICIVLSFTTVAFAEDERKAGEEKTIAGMKFCWIPSGSFMMGSPKSEAGRDDDEGPRHRVEISKGFWMGKYEVTQREWEDVMGGWIMGDNPSSFKGSKRPVETVSWNDCQKFIEKLNSRHKEVEFALPTEAQWEYACRAGTTSPFYFGATITPQQVNYNGSYPYGNASKGLDRGETTKVGSFPSNAWGLHDMHGNVREWCQDWYGENYYSESPSRDPRGPSSGTYRVLRGGSWNSNAKHCLSANRNWFVPDLSYVNSGFRLVVVSPRTP